MKVRNLLIVIFLSCAILFSFNLSVYSQWTSSGVVAITGSWPSISVANPNVIWIAGGLSTPQIFRSVNGGSTWTTIPTNGLPAKALMCIWGVDSLVAYVGDGGDAQGQTGGDALLSKTTNGGLNWFPVANTGGTVGFFNGVVFSRTMPSFGFAQSDPPTGTGTPYYVLKTTNGGNNWFLTNPPGVSGNASAQNSLFAIDNMFYGFGMNASAVAYMTSNGGANWYSGTLGITGTFVAGLAFNTNKIYGIASTSNSFPNISRTTNGGVTWSSVNVGGTGTTTLSCCKWIPNSNTCYYVGASSSAAIIRKSTNSGQNWTTMTAPSGVVNFTHFDFCLSGNTVTGFAISPAGNIIKLTESVTLIKNENTIPAEFKLEQNYPNPFNPTTTIRFSLPEKSFVVLKVYDALGRAVSTVVNEIRNAGVYSETFTADNLTTGVYYYKIETDKFSDVKKFVYIK